MKDGIRDGFAGQSSRSREPELMTQMLLTRGEGRKQEARADQSRRRGGGEGREAGRSSGCELEVSRSKGDEAGAEAFQPQNKGGEGANGRLQMSRHYLLCKESTG